MYILNEINCLNVKITFIFQITCSGIINYNDHLNICHFSDRKFICIYCHEGFNKEHDKIVHENEHIGISKLNIPSMPSTARFDLM